MASAPPSGIRDLVALVNAEEAAEDAVQLESQVVGPGELPLSLSRVHSHELLHRASQTSPRGSPRALPSSPSSVTNLLGGPSSPHRSPSFASLGQRGSRHPSMSPLGPTQPDGGADVNVGSPSGSDTGVAISSAVDSPFAARGVRHVADE